MQKSKTNKNRNKKKAKAKYINNLVAEGIDKQIAVVMAELILNPVLSNRCN